MCFAMYDPSPSTRAPLALFRENRNFVWMWRNIENDVHGFRFDGHFFYTEEELISTIRKGDVFIGYPQHIIEDSWINMGDTCLYVYGIDEVIGIIRTLEL